ncbi:MAG TPA: DUF6010 family protein [Longimicrobium sp.]|jgi:hypothetical protein
MHAHPDSTNRRSPAIPALIGIVLALPFIAILMYHPDGAYDLLALILAFTGGVYTGSALRAEVATRKLAIEWAFGAVLVILAALSFWWSPTWLAAGFGAHAVWDVAHHARPPGLGIRRWFPPFCAAFDVAVAALVLFYA